MRSEGIIRAPGECCLQAFWRAPMCSPLPGTRLVIVQEEEEKVNVSAWLPRDSSGKRICKNEKDLPMREINPSCEIKASPAYTKWFIPAQTGGWFSATVETDWSSNPTTSFPQSWHNWEGKKRLRNVKTSFILKKPLQALSGQKSEDSIHSPFRKSNL